MKRVLGIGVLALLAGCSAEDRAEREREAFIQARIESAAALAAEKAAADVAAKEASVVVAKASEELTDAVKGKVCRAAIANVMGRDPSIIRVLSNSDGITRVRYTRDDGTVWTNECRVHPGNVEWRAIDGGRVGRWRTEDTIRYRVDGSRITIEQFMSGEHIDTRTYTVS